MQYRTFGKAGWQVSAIGMGCWAIGGNMWGPTDDNDSIAAIQASIDAGVNLLDTADAYRAAGVPAPAEPQLPAQAPDVASR